MSVVLTTHIEPGFDNNDPMTNQNLFFHHVVSGTDVFSGDDLQPGEEYILKLNVLNAGEDKERRMFVDIYYSESIAESYAELTRIGLTLREDIDGGETITVRATESFIPEESKNYRFYGIAYSDACPKPDAPDATNDQVAGQTAALGEKNVLLTLHDGLDSAGNSIGQNPNFYLESSGNEYLLKARVVNNGTSTDRVQVVFYAKDKGTNNPIATSEIASVQGNGGEYVFTSMEKWSHEHGDNELMAVCSTISEADQYSSKNFNPSDRHVAQTNLHSANS